jgi:hypothetical protein
MFLSLYPGGIISGTHSIEVWVGPRADLEAIEKRKFLPVLEIELGRPDSKSALHRFIPALHIFSHKNDI